MTDSTGKPASSGFTAIASASQTRAAAPARSARLQYLRGFAALAVLLFHASERHLALMSGDSSFHLVFSTFWGVQGVAIFFALSGYLMSQLSVRNEPGRFLLDRILRIYPMMWIVVGLTALTLLITGYGRSIDPVALTLIPAGKRDYILGGVEWTLLFEMTYYVVIAIMMLAGWRRWLELLFAAWLVVLLVLGVTGIAPPDSLRPTLIELLGQSSNSAFVMGFLLPRLLSWRGLPPSWMLALTVVPLTALYFLVPMAAHRWIAGLSALMLVAAALQARNPARSGPLHDFGMRLGDSSYALYLCHIPFMVITSNFLSPRFYGVGVWFGWVLGSLGLSLLLGSLDVGLHRRLKHWAGALSDKRTVGLSLAFIAIFFGVAAFAEIKTRSTDQAIAQARASVMSSPAQPWASALVGLDSGVILQDGRLVLRGYAIDQDAPDGAAHIAVLQNGAVIAVDRMTRMRPRIAEAAGRPDLASIRFGFSVITDGAFNCTGGALSARAVLPNGKVVPIASPVLDTVCAPTTAPAKP